MKSHEQKMAVKKEHEQELERNDLNAWLMSFWTRLKSGQLISRKFAMWALLIGAAIGLSVYLMRGTRNNQAAAWRSLETTVGVEALKDYAKDSPDTIQGKVARLQVARQLLGVQGLPLLSHINPDTRGKAITAVTEARELFTKLIEDFKDDMTLQGQAIDGAGKAELALIGIPRDGSPPPPNTEFLGSPEKAGELFSRFAKLVGEATPSGEAARKMAETLADPKKRGEVLQLGMYLNSQMKPAQPTPVIPPSLTPAAPPPGPTPVAPPEPKK